MADGRLKRTREYDDDPFENFQFDPPKPNSTPGAFRSFTRRSKYRAMSNMASLSGSRDFSAFGSNTSLSAMSGSSQNLLDSNKMMSLQEDARSRRISAEVMKHRLYESVIISPRHRRLSMRADYAGPSGGDNAEMQGFHQHAHSRMAMSMPVTPAHSHNVTPQHSPTSANKRFQWPGWFSRGTTPRGGATPTDEVNPGAHEDIMEVEEDSWKGLACLFKPQPKYVPAGRWSHSIENEEQEMDIEGRRTSPVQDRQEDNGVFLRDVPKRQKRSGSPGKERQAIPPNTF